MEKALISTDFKNEQIYQLLKDVLFASFNIETFFIKDSQNISDNFDHGIREMMWPGYRDRPTSKKVSANLNQPFTITSMRSQLGFYNLIITLPSELNTVVISVGPFRAEDTTPRYYEKILQNAHVPAELLNSASAIFRELPKANPSTIAIISKRICREIYDEFSDKEIMSIDFVNEIHEEIFSPEQMNAHEHANAKKIQTLFFNFRHALINGDTKGARDLVYSEITDYLSKEERGLKWQKYILYRINMLATTSLFETSVHPYRVLQLQEQMNTTIEECQDAVTLSLIPYDIAHKYCLLVKNHSNEDCSAGIRDILDYISFNLDGDLSLSAIAATFNKNSSTLSATFHEQTGMTLTEYVTHARVREAIRLFNTSSASISDVAITVGYNDFAYFSKQFKKVTGMSPRDYKLNTLSLSTS